MGQNVEKRGERWRISLWDKGLWDAKRSCQGQRVKETLPASVKTKREALAIQRQKQDELDRHYAGLTQSPNPSEQSWIETAAKVLAEKKVKNGEPWFDFCDQIVKRFASRVGDVAAGKVTTEQCHAYVLERTSEIGSSYLRKEITLLRAIFLRANCVCWKEVPLPRKKQGKVVFFSTEQFTKLLTVVSDEHAFRYMFLINTGVRRAEAWASTWGDVLLEQQAIIINNAQKGQGTRWPMRRLPLSPQLHQLLSERYARQLKKHRKACGDPEARIDKELLFPCRQNWRRDLQNACERAAIDTFTIHDLRHTFCSWLAQAGVPLIKIRDLAGHESITTTEIYAHLCPMDNDMVVSALGAKCVPIVSPKPPTAKKKGDPKIA